MGSLKFNRIACFLAFGLILYYLSPRLYRFSDYVRQVNPFSGQRAVERAFTPTQRELACLHGLSPGPLASPALTNLASASVHAPAGPIPNVVHFIFLQKLPLAHDDQGDFDFLAYLAVRSALVALKPDRVVLHYGYIERGTSASLGDDDDPLLLNNLWIARLQKDIQLQRHHRGLNTSLQHSAHLADTLRLEILLEHGGIYLDIDGFALRSFRDVLESPHPHDIVLGNEGGNRAGLCNAVIAARPNSTFVRHWLERYAMADLNKEWNYHSVVLPKELASRYPDEICELPPDAFFWPTWTWRHVEWMHEPINKAEVQRCHDKIEQTGGALLDNQLAYHAWSQMARDRYLNRLTPGIVHSEDTRFNLLMRRFIEDGL